MRHWPLKFDSNEEKLLGPKKTTFIFKKKNLRKSPRGGIFIFIFPAALLTQHYLKLIPTWSAINFISDSLSDLSDVSANELQRFFQTRKHAGSERVLEETC